jgi:hypothetical protein
MSDNNERKRQQTRDKDGWLVDEHGMIVDEAEGERYMQHVLGKERQQTPPFKGRAPPREEPVKKADDDFTFFKARKTPEDSLPRHMREDKVKMAIWKLYDGIINYSWFPPKPQQPPVDLSKKTPLELYQIESNYQLMQDAWEQGKREKRSLAQKLKQKLS